MMRRLSSQQRMWNAMRRLRVFSWPEILAAASDEEHHIKPHTARSYVSMLHRHGYLQCVQARSRERRARYRLRRDTGPRAPGRMTDRRGRTAAVRDHNTGRIYERGDMS